MTVEPTTASAIVASQDCSCCNVTFNLCTAAPKEKKKKKKKQKKKRKKKRAASDRSQCYTGAGAGSSVELFTNTFPLQFSKTRALVPPPPSPTPTHNPANTPHRHVHTSIRAHANVHTTCTQCVWACVVCVTAYSYIPRNRGMLLCKGTAPSSQSRSRTPRHRNGRPCWRLSWSCSRPRTKRRSRFRCWRARWTQRQSYFRRKRPHGIERRAKKAIVCKGSLGEGKGS